jgi:hypothetical protein
MSTYLYDDYILIKGHFKKAPTICFALDNNGIFQKLAAFRFLTLSSPLINPVQPRSQCGRGKGRGEINRVLEAEGFLPEL